jgi:hypothetical protein
MKKWFVIAALMLWGCGESSVTTAPDVVLEPTPLGVSQGESMAVREWEKPVFKVDGEFMTATIYNPKRGNQYVGLACYQGQVFDIDAQVLGTANHAKITRLGSGETVTLKVAMHCGHNQCDAFHGLREAPEPPYFGSNLLGAELEFYTCAPPVPDPPPEDPPEECIKTPVPEGFRECPEVSGPDCIEVPCCTFDAELCEWVCGEIPPPPPPPPVPECPGDIDTGCMTLDRPLGNPTAECAYFNMVPLYKKEYSWGRVKLATKNADLAIVKAGRTYNVYAPVKKYHTWLWSCQRKTISHITYCVCPSN